MKKAKFTAVSVSLLALSAVVFATPAVAENGTTNGGCWVDAYGRCKYMTPDQVTAPFSAADWAAYGTTPDQHFAYHLTHDSYVPGFIIMDFDLVKAQGIRACQQRANGMPPVDVVYDLQRIGGYTFGQANIIASACLVFSQTG